ncbi:Wzz/FepE/Etk N-terminal domain-containing protein [Streptomyces griseoaurantiacus]|uniref:Wzz/FepE/Etk N-terminal domain-containing protein n=1 Tax=Streptomyces griseoaurantiacus TaxID=68213 RepID=UPI0036A43503
MTTHQAGEASADAPLIDLQSLLAAVRRRRRLWGALALLGLLVGAAVAVLLPPAPTATTTVLVTHEDDQPNDTGTLIRTDVELLGTTRIAGAALRALGSSQKPGDFLRDYRGTGLTNNLLRIEVTGDSDAEAVDRAGALANAFVADHVRRMRRSADAEAQALLDQRDRMRKELAQVNKAIGDESPEQDPKASASVESLFARRAELNSRIADFDERAAEARTGEPEVLAGTQIVDDARVVPRSLPRALATDAAIGLVLGLVLGLAVAAVGAVVGDRPVLRREIAAHLGTSVLAELRPGGRRARAARARLTTTLARTVRGTDEAAAVDAPVALLELGCARTAALLARDLASALETEGGPVLLVDGLPGQEAVRSGRRGGPKAVALSEAPADEGTSAGRRIGLGSVRPGTAWSDLPHLGGRAVLVVRAGHGSAAWLHTVARRLAEQRVEVLGTVLVGPDPRDRTDGTLWDGGRGEWPVRRNGVAARPRAERPSMPVPRVPGGSDQEVR